MNENTAILINRVASLKERAERLGRVSGDTSVTTGRPPLQVDLAALEDLIADRTKTIGDAAALLGMSRNSFMYHRAHYSDFRDAYKRGMDRRKQSQSKPIDPAVLVSSMQRIIDELDVVVAKSKIKLSKIQKALSHIAKDGRPRNEV